MELFMFIVLVLLLMLMTVLIVKVYCSINIEYFIKHNAPNLVYLNEQDIEELRSVASFSRFLRNINK